MSRSSRRPYAAITGVASAKDDKRLAHRGVRRKQNLALKTCNDYEDFLPPHPLECPWNNTWCWNRDGGQYYCGSMRHSVDASDQKYYCKLQRK
jgi:hypothetical protein